MKSASDEQRKPRGACTPKGSPTKLIYPYTGKLTSFRDKNSSFPLVRYIRLSVDPACGGFAPNGASRPMQIKKQTAFMPLYAPCFLRKTSTRPSGSLRMTKSADGRLPSIIAYRRHQKQLKLFLELQCEAKSAHCLRYMECHIPPTSKTTKPFLELRCILCRLVTQK